MLTDAECKNATCPTDKARKRLACSGGLYLEVSPAGSKRWFLKYRIAGSEKQLALGSYPTVTLKAARKARDAAKLQKSTGLDPVQARKIEKLKSLTSTSDTFKAAALEWAPLGIRVNTLVPGFFPAEQNKKVLTPERVAKIMGHRP